MSYSTKKSEDRFLRLSIITFLSPSADVFYCTITGVLPLEKPLSQPKEYIPGRQWARGRK